MNEIKHIIAIASGKGGVGKSTTAANLALALQARGAQVGLLDADIYGPSQQLMLGVAEGVRPEQQGGQFLLPIKAHGLRTMSMGYLVTEKTPMVWRGPMAGGALAQMLEQTLWGPLDYLIIDMPPGTGDVQLTLSQKASLAGAIIVTTPQDIALLDAQKGIEMFRKVDVPILGIVENMAIHVCSNCGHQEHIFGENGGEQIAAEYGVPLLASLPLDRGIREQMDAGQPTVMAQPNSPVTALYLQMADKIRAVLVQEGDDGVRQFPNIQISDD
ncbi:iron-sulfur cluster carrier protein ApbC [Halieaceae bacterium IMCC8485]|jgi:ATP-binding protein involved in chromosome partitioning|uniref:Iron-sulfur cluster carrier protein n=1 Tax=Candidatus Seongchinamella marina TaxID=2518990 RepID=A0ABT3SX91_9GAMM|nr:iron-sulfur cluster carrier protein ApbC [Candidatus Seongchinamella marina]MCX2974622.1 iron-sulfur cluster carrier protein ApbC [Candidatus Seongchinamella marina]